MERNLLDKIWELPGNEATFNYFWILYTGMACVASDKYQFSALKNFIGTQPRQNEKQNAVNRGYSQIVAALE